MPNNHTQVVDFYTKTEEQAKEIQAFLLGKGKIDGTVTFDFNKVVPCHCYSCNSDKVKLAKKCKELSHFSCEKCIKAFKDAGVKEDEWYDIHVNIWGTKWNSCDNAEPIIRQYSGVDISEEQPMGFNLHYEFWTAWSPPIPVYDALSKHLKDKYGNDVWFEVVCHDEFVWVPDDEKNPDTDFHVDPDQLFYYNSIDKQLIQHPVKMWNVHENHRTEWENTFRRKNHEIWRLGIPDEE